MFVCGRKNTAGKYLHVANTLKADLSYVDNPDVLLVLTTIIKADPSYVDNRDVLPVLTTMNKADQSHVDNRDVLLILTTMIKRETPTMLNGINKQGS